MFNKSKKDGDYNQFRDEDRSGMCDYFASIPCEEEMKKYSSCEYIFDGSTGYYAYKCTKKLENNKQNGFEDIMKDFTVEVEYKPEIVEFSKKVYINITNIKNIELEAILFINDKLVKALKENNSERIEIARELLNISIKNMLNKNK